MTDNHGEVGRGALKGQALRACDLLSYQKGAIVSRTVVDSKAGTVTMFAFDRGQGLSEHTAPFDALAYLLEGEMEVTISGTPVRLTQGDMVIMPADEPHALRAQQHSKVMLVMIRS